MTKQMTIREYWQNVIKKPFTKEDAEALDKEIANYQKQVNKANHYFSWSDYNRPYYYVNTVF